jgi:hypothetical protein
MRATLLSIGSTRSNARTVVTKFVEPLVSVAGNQIRIQFFDEVRNPIKLIANRKVPCGVNALRRQRHR